MAQTLHLVYHLPFRDVLLLSPFGFRSKLAHYANLGVTEPDTREPDKEQVFIAHQLMTVTSKFQRINELFCHDVNSHICQAWFLSTFPAWQFDLAFQDWKKKKKKN